MQVVGIIVPELFPHRGDHGNRYLTTAYRAGTLMERLTMLIDSANIYVVVPGSVGSLGEFVLVWNHISIDFMTTNTSKKHVICYRNPWEKVFNDISADLDLKAIDVQHIHFVDNEEEVLAIISIITLN